MTGSTVHVTAHGPLRVATGHAGRGLDAVVDRDRVPASSLKGVMRATATHLLALPTPTVDRLFGTATSASPWAWSDVDLRSPDVSASVASRVRVAIDSDSGTVRDGALMHAEGCGSTVTPCSASSRPTRSATLLGTAGSWPPSPGR